MAQDSPQSGEANTSNNGRNKGKQVEYQIKNDNDTSLAKIETLLRQVIEQQKTDSQHLIRVEANIDQINKKCVEYNKNFDKLFANDEEYKNGSNNIHSEQKY